MRSSHGGTVTSAVEVLNVSPHGVWLAVRGKEYFLPYEDFPWFQEARLADLHRVTLLHRRHLQWETLDVDLDLDVIEDPDRYPLKYS